jgi:hypothetical protein
MSDSIISIIASYMEAKERIKMRRVCKLVNTEFIPSPLTQCYNFKIAQKVFDSLKVKGKKNRRNNTWKRKLHTEDEVIIIF